MGRGANNTAITPTKGFEIGSRVHVSNRNDARVISQYINEHLPTFFYFTDIRHVGH